MLVGEICSRKVRTVPSRLTVLEAAQRMKKHNVGSLVVAGHQGPVEGLITDRDIVVRWVAEGCPPSLTVSDVMTRGMIGVSEDTKVERAIVVMGERQVRRLVVTNEFGDLVGVLALDDVLGLLSHEVESISRLLVAQQPA